MKVFPCLLAVTVLAGTSPAGALTNCATNNGAAFTGSVSGTTLTVTPAATAQVYATLSGTTMTVPANASYASSITHTGPYNSQCITGQSWQQVDGGTLVGTLVVGLPISGASLGAGAKIASFGSGYVCVTPAQSYNNIVGVAITMSAVVSGTLASGMDVTGTGLTAGTTVSGSSSPYTLSQSATTESSPVLITGNRYTTSGSIAVGQVLLGSSSLTGETTIASGSAGSWTISPSSGTVASTALTTSWDLTSTVMTSLMQNAATSIAASTSYIYEVDTSANNHEALMSDGSVWDYKLGPAVAHDPSAKVGIYTITAGTGTAPAHISYTYGSGSPYLWYISPVTAGTNSSLNFCSDATASPTATTPVTISTVTNPG